MKRLCCVLVIAVAGSLPAFAASAPVATGMPAPDVSLHFLDGTGARLGDWLGRRPVYLKMWATWCSTCRSEMPHFRDLYDQYGREVLFLSVNAGLNDTYADVRNFNAEYGLQMPTVVDVDGSIGQALDLIATPYHVLIDVDGSIVHLGHRDSQRVDALLAELAGRAPGPAPGGAPHGNPRPAKAEFPGEGDPAPAFSIATLSGPVFTLDGAAEPDGLTWLFFFTTWCEPYFDGEGNDPGTADSCRKSRRAVDAAFSDPAGAPRLIGIASRMWTGPKDLLQYRQSRNPPYPLALDETNAVFQLYGVREFPTLIAVSGGRIVKRLTGEVTALPGHQE